MAKLPAFDPISIAVMSFGILLVTALALTPGRAANGPACKRIAQGEHHDFRR
jgi:hypothetical protein